MRALMYSLEDCASCEGTGVTGTHACECCDGQGKINVLQPSIICPRCNGTGKATREELFSSSGKCFICFGTGWARTRASMTGTE
jgi:DnaJ-class molecular chaperone